VPVEEVARALDRLRFAPRVAGDHVNVTVPSYRLDVNIEVDLVEEVARIVGYGRIPMREEISIRLQPEDPAKKATEAIRDTLVASGYFEAVTFSFVSDALADDFNRLRQRDCREPIAAVRKADARLRPSLLPGLLEALARNENNGNVGAKLYEIGSAFWTDAGGHIIERRQVGLVGSPEMREVRGAVEAVLSRLNSDAEIRVVPDGKTGFGQGACGRIDWGGRGSRLAGEDRARHRRIGFPCARCRPAAELDLAALLEGARGVPQLKALPKFRRSGAICRWSLVKQSPMSASNRWCEPQRRSIWKSWST